MGAMYIALGAIHNSGAMYVALGAMYMAIYIAMYIAMYMVSLDFHLKITHFTFVK